MAFLLYAFGVLLFLVGFGTMLPDFNAIRMAGGLVGVGLGVGLVDLAAILSTLERILARLSTPQSTAPEYIPELMRSSSSPTPLANLSGALFSDQVEVPADKRRR